MDIAVIENEVKTLLGAEGSGHDWEHIRRVTAIARRLAEQEDANSELAIATALLHDVDDRKVTGSETSEDELPAARRILTLAGATGNEAEAVCANIQSMGYHKSLGGVTPQTPEAKVVGDADYLDAIGAIGVARCFTFGGSRSRPIFVPDQKPMDELSKDAYINNVSASVNHFFEKLLRLKDLMQTRAGKEEALRRHQFMVEYLRTLFEETDAPHEWKDLLRAAA